MRRRYSLPTTADEEVVAHARIEWGREEGHQQGFFWQRNITKSRLVVSFEKADATEDVCP